MPPKISKGKAPFNRRRSSRPGSLIGTNSESQLSTLGEINQPGVSFGQSTIARKQKASAGGRETPVYLMGPSFTVSSSSFMVSSPTDHSELDAVNPVILSRANVEAAFSQMHGSSLQEKIDRAFPDPPISLTGTQSASGQNSVCD